VRPVSRTVSSVRHHGLSRACARTDRVLVSMTPRPTDLRIRAVRPRKREVMVAVVWPGLSQVRSSVAADRTSASEPRRQRCGRMYPVECRQSSGARAQPPGSQASAGARRVRAVRPIVLDRLHAISWSAWASAKRPPISCEAPAHALPRSAPYHASLPIAQGPLEIHPGAARPRIDPDDTRSLRVPHARDARGGGEEARPIGLRAWAWCGEPPTSMRRRRKTDAVQR
jgi:hypothetical protein